MGKSIYSHLVEILPNVPNSFPENITTWTEQILELSLDTTKLSRKNFYQDLIFLFQTFKNGWIWWGILHHVTIPLDCCHHWFFLDQMRPEGGYHSTT